VYFQDKLARLNAAITEGLKLQREEVQAAEASVTGLPDIEIKTRVVEEEGEKETWIEKKEEVDVKEDWTGRVPLTQVEQEVKTIIEELIHGANSSPPTLGDVPQHRDSVGGPPTQRKPGAVATAEEAAGAMPTPATRPTSSKITNEGSAGIVLSKTEEPVEEIREKEATNQVKDVIDIDTDRVKDMIGITTDRVKEVIEVTTDKVKEVIEVASDRAKNTKDFATDRVKDIKDITTDRVKDFKDSPTDRVKDRAGGLRDHPSSHFRPANWTEDEFFPMPKSNLMPKESLGINPSPQKPLPKREESHSLPILPHAQGYPCV
jgi:hypothetical protein